MPQPNPPDKSVWDLVATLGNGFLVALALVFMFWAACSDGGSDEGLSEISQPAASTSVQS